MPNDERMCSVVKQLGIFVVIDAATGRLRCGMKTRAEALAKAKEYGYRTIKENGRTRHILD